jgi:hypothetical protein
MGVCELPKQESLGIRFRTPISQPTMNKQIKIIKYTKHKQYLSRPAKRISDPVMRYGRLCPTLKVRYKLGVGCRIQASL